MQRPRADFHGLDWLADHDPERLIQLLQPLLRRAAASARLAEQDSLLVAVEILNDAYGPDRAYWRAFKRRCWKRVDTRLAIEAPSHTFTGLDSFAASPPDRAERDRVLANR